MTGLHPEKNYNNIRNLLFRLHNYQTNIDIKSHIVFKTNEADRYENSVLPKDIRRRLSQEGFNINFVSYESDFLKAGGSHCPHTPSSLTVQHEPLREFIKTQDILDSEFVLKTRTDIHIDDRFIETFLDESFYGSLRATAGPNTVFEYKIWNSLIGPSNVFEFTDYFFLARTKELKSTLMNSHHESEYMWRHPIASCDNVQFAEKLQYIKPLLPLIEERGVEGVGSDFYWDIVKSNFLVSCIGEGDDPRRPRLDRNR